MINDKEMKRLLSLATQQREIADSDKMKSILADWRRHGSFDRTARPMVTIELWTFSGDVVPKLMECENEEARWYEAGFLGSIVNHTLFNDDTVVLPYKRFTCSGWFTPFGIDIRTIHSKDSEGSDLGHQFISQIKDLEEDFHKLKKSTFGISSMEDVRKSMDRWNELFGDILPAKLDGCSIYACPTQAIVHIMSMEDWFVAMYDYPELCHKMMDMLTNDYIEYFKLLETSGLLLSTNDAEGVAQGTYAFNSFLPVHDGPYKTNEIFGYLDSQETSGLSPEMYHEFVFPYYERMAKEFGALSYGCCEAVDPIWETSVSKYSNLSKVSISPWCNEEYMGEQLRDRNVMYLRKPSPNHIGVGSVLNEDEVRRAMMHTVECAKGCQLEIVQRDVYRLHNDYTKVRRYVEIIRECLEHKQ